jgi:hypothetical protein
LFIFGLFCHLTANSLAAHGEIYVFIHSESYKNKFIILN